MAAVAWARDHFPGERCKHRHDGIDDVFHLHVRHSVTSGRLFALRRLALVLVVAVCALGLSAIASAASSPGHPLTNKRAVGDRALAGPFLLALGDSLAAGYQPSDGNASPPVDATTGFSDEGYPGGYSTDLASAEHLRLVDLACPGETTASMTSTPALPPCASVYRREFAASSQLGAAMHFLHAHKGQVRLVTIDLGANDIEHCLDGGAPSPTCLRDGATSIAKELPTILEKIKRTVAKDDPGALLIGMNYYDPFLGLDFRPGTAKASAEAFLSLVLVDTYNAELSLAYSAEKIPTADVASAFSTSKTMPITTYDTRRLPRNVAIVCRLTWMCPLTGTTSPPDIHANSSGYRVIAGAFERVLSRS